MTSKKQPIAYPAPHVELTRAIAGVEAVVEKMHRHATVFSMRPAELQALTVAQVDADRKLAEADADALARGDAAVLAEAAALVYGDSPDHATPAHGEAANIAALEVAANKAREALARFTRQSAALATLGDGLNAELDAALAVLAAECPAYVNAVQDVIADRIVAKAGELAELYAVQETFSSVVGVPAVWQEFAHVSDPRAARRSFQSGDVAFDLAPNLLTQAAPGTEAEVQAARRALEPVATAQRLARTAQQVRPSHSQNGVQR
ncbi:hypothetical protein [Paraburkholderia sediminicola]|uniref:hypothetical protein n=1 Tax=Paraburkholderia sediminicola TaxID=458836 RepID=UPI0038B8FFAB